MKGLNLLAAFLGGAYDRVAALGIICSEKEKTPVTKSQKFSVGKRFV